MWLPKVKKVVSRSGEKASGEDLSTLNAALVDSLAVVLAAQDSPTMVSVCGCVCIGGGVCIYVCVCVCVCVCVIMKIVNL